MAGKRALWVCTSSVLDRTSGNNQWDGRHLACFLKSLFRSSFPSCCWPSSVLAKSLQPRRITLAGVAFVLNSVSCHCPWPLALLRPLADALATIRTPRLGLVAGHAHRQFNTRADELSHALPHQVSRELGVQGRTVKADHMTFNFVVHDMQQNEAFSASMSFPLGIMAGTGVAF